MKDKKLYDVLRILSADEFKMLRIAVQSPQYFGSLTSEKLYSALRPKYPDFSLSPTDLRKVYKKVFPNKDYNSKALQKSFDDLLKVVEAFLLKLQIDKDEFLRLKVLTITTGERPDLFYLFQKTQDNMHDLLEEKEIINERYWDEKAQLYDHLYRNVQHDNYSSDDKTLDKLNEATNNFFAHFVTHKNASLQNTSDDTKQNSYSLFSTDIKKMNNGE